MRREVAIILGWFICFLITYGFTNYYIAGVFIAISIGMLVLFWKKKHHPIVRAWMLKRINIKNEKKSQVA